MSDASVPTTQSAWMAILAKATFAPLEQRFRELPMVPDSQFLRSPEIGLAIVRGRTEGTGDPFNLGEITLTRCVVQIAIEPEQSVAGFGYVAGRSQRHAELAAVCDGMLQPPDWHDIVGTQVIAPLQAEAQARRDREAAQVEATRVNFFTLKRGES